MATIKAYTDLQQSQTLAKILPLESADMAYIASATDDDGEPLYTAEYKSEIIIHDDDDYIDCWSLAALMGVLPERYAKLIKEGGMYRIIIRDSCMTSLFDNPVDACYEIILKLHELKML